MKLPWTSANTAVRGAAGAVEILDARELARHPDKPACSQELVAAYNEKFANPKIAQAGGYVDGVIAPADTRCAQRRNGNVPL